MAHRPYPGDEQLESTTVPAPSFANGGAMQSARKRTANSNKMSVVSQQYDTGNKGYLDETEQTMREMDKDGLGHLSNDAVYKMMGEQLKMQQKVFNLKRIVIGLSLFTVVLAITNLGTAWAAAVLAKETTIDNASNAEGAAVMMTKDGTRPIGVRPVGAHYDIQEEATEEGRRILSQALQTHRGRDLLDETEHDTEGREGAYSIGKGIARAMYSDCLASSSSTINFACPRIEIGASVCGPNADFSRSLSEGDEEQLRVYMFGEVTIACPFGNNDIMCSASMGRRCPHIFMPRPGGMTGPGGMPDGPGEMTVPSSRAGGNI